LAVDGLPLRLRRFRKSLQLIPAGPRRDQGIAIGSDASCQLVPACCVGTKPSCLNLFSENGKVETEMSLLEGIIDSLNNPLAVVEDIAADNNWSF